MRLVLTVAMFGLLIVTAYATPATSMPDSRDRFDVVVFQDICNSTNN